MTADVVVSRELKSLQDELSAAQRERSAAPPVAPMPQPGSAEPLKDSEARLIASFYLLSPTITGPGGHHI